MINQKTCTTFKIETCLLIGQENLILRPLSSQLIREKTMEKFEGAPLDISVTDFMR